MNKIITMTVNRCGVDCPHYQDEDVDVYHGCNWTPGKCTKADKWIEGAERDKRFPSFCPLPNKELLSNKHIEEPADA
jgi:hypothetical protein